MVARPLTVIQMLPDLESGGVERGTLEIGRFLASDGHKSMVISAGGRLTPQLQDEGSTHIRWRVGEKSPRCLRYIIPLRNLMLQHKVDILHLRSRLPAWIGYLAWKNIPHHRRPALITTFHGFYSVNLYSSVMARGEKVIAVSKAIARHLREQYALADDRIVLIYRGVDEHLFNPLTIDPDKTDALRVRWGIKDNHAPIIMLPGRITRLKGHDLFIESLARIRDTPWLAVCTGDTAANRSLTRRLTKKIAHLKLTDRIKLVGHCDDMPSALMLADIVVAASVKPESYGRVAVEAQAMGKPVVACAHGGIVETISDRQTGWLIAPDNVAEMANTLHEAVVNTPLREQMGGRAREWVKTQFSMQKMCQSTLNLYVESASAQRGVQNER